MPVISRSVNWNEKILNPVLRINWRAILVPAAVVIPDPVAYIKVVSVKKLVVSLLVGAIGLTLYVGTRILSHHRWVEPVCHYVFGQGIPIVY